MTLEEHVAEAVTHEQSTLTWTRPDALVGSLMLGGAADVEMRWSDGAGDTLPVSRWHGEVTREEVALLARARGPVLDIGCGPGRLVAHLERAGVTALGIDVLPEAVARARLRGGRALRRSVFGKDVRAGSWATALILDGNVGIGGDPVSLMARVAQLLSRDGRALVELEPTGVGLQSDRVRIETADRGVTELPWGRVGADAIEELCRRTGFAVHDLWRAADRDFAEVRLKAS